MSTLEQKYLQHILKSDLISKFPEVRSRVMLLPVCPRCERPALRDTRKGDAERRYITCPVCGYHGPFTRTVKCHMQEENISPEQARRPEEYRSLFRLR
jgi:uncharacterized Zn finger protein (UPF0148 family)